MRQVIREHQWTLILNGKQRAVMSFGCFLPWEGSPSKCPASPQISSSMTSVGASRTWETLSHTETQGQACGNAPGLLGSLGALQMVATHLNPDDCCPECEGGLSPSLFHSSLMNVTFPDTPYDLLSKLS